jgi:hypothetical protein
MLNFTGQRHTTTLLSALPGYLERLCTAIPSGHPWSTPQVLLQGHTALPYFTYFDAPALRIDTMHQVGRIEVGHHAAMSLGLTSYRCDPTPAHPRFCIRCVLDDRDRFGFAYFHREHQLPAVTVCWKHASILADGCRHCGPYPLRKRSFTTPGSCDCAGGCLQTPALVNHPCHIEKLLWIAEESARMVSSEGTRISDPVLSLKQLVRAKGFGRGTLPLYRKLGEAIETRFGSATLGWLGYPAWRNARPAPWICRALTGHGSGRRKPAIILLLFLGAVADSVAEFESRATVDTSVCRSVDNTSRASAPGTEQAPPRKEQLEQLLAQHDYNLCSAAESLGLTPSAVATESRRHSIRVPLSAKAAKRIGQPRLRRIQAALRNGVDKKVVLSRHRISDWTLLLVELDDPAAVRDGLLAKAERRREVHRRKILNRIRRNPLTSRQDIERHLSGTYDFMLREDRIWFRRCFPIRKAAKYHPPRTRAPEQLARDRDTANTIVRLARIWRTSSEKPVRITKCRLLSDLNLLTRYYQAPQTFRMTTHALATTVETKEQFLERKIRWAIAELKGRGKRISINVLRRASGLPAKTLRARRALVVKAIGELHAGIAPSSFFNAP